MSACHRSTRTGAATGFEPCSPGAAGAGVSGPFPVQGGPRLTAVVVAPDAVAAAMWGVCLAAAGWAVTGWASATVHDGPAPGGGAAGRAPEAGTAVPARIGAAASVPRWVGPISGALRSVPAHAVVIADHPAEGRDVLAMAVEAALGAGKHVLVELAEADDPDQMRRWEAMGERAGAAVVVAGPCGAGGVRTGDQMLRAASALLHRVLGPQAPADGAGNVANRAGPPVGL